MKSLIKYTATLFILLMLGYTQVFAHVHRDDFSSVSQTKKSHHVQAPVAQSSAIDGNYFEEESKRNLLKSYSGTDAGSDFFYAHVSAEYFFQHVGSATTFGERSPRLATNRASLFRVLRL